MHTCRKCGTKIANDRKYCSVHYKEAMAQYHRDVKKYENDFAEWSNMTQHERENQNSMAETVETGVYAAGVGSIVGIISWIYLAKTYSIDALYGLLLVFLCIVLFFFVPAIRMLAGRIARAVVKSLIYFIALVIVTWLISLISKMVHENLSMIFFADAGLAVMISLFKELGGGHHASGKPIRPTEPRH